jgi:hypothetical protein
MYTDHILLLHGEQNLYNINTDKKQKTRFKTGDTYQLESANIMQMEVFRLQHCQTNL